ncbi:hypothetical protein EK21DRAFT_109600 [Setomelanomma holmii]|uniref:Uncharacterized protein n=1 Tax=Setomelanomma holmii TaxID=210430 RepID=A0A9P4HEM1_9PLEO|nr:hypothetical protein EK21DRAFT_109600 [Setomelanomma holmii]
MNSLRSVLRFLVAIVALITIPLMAWHQAERNLHDNMGMPRFWVEDFRNAQSSPSMTWLWIMMWVLIPIDLLHAIHCLGADQALNRQPFGSMNVPRLRHLVILALYDALLVLVLALYIFDFATAIALNKAVCKARGVVDYSLWSLDLQDHADGKRNNISESDGLLTLSAYERCSRLMRSINMAGGLGCAVAAIHALLHLTTFLLSVGEACYIGFRLTKGEGKDSEHVKSEDGGLEGSQPAPYIDIRTRPARNGGHLTGISEEECRTGGDARQRRSHYSGQS